MRNTGQPKSMLSRLLRRRIYLGPLIIAYLAVETLMGLPGEPNLSMIDKMIFAFFAFIVFVWMIRHAFAREKSMPILFGKQTIRNHDETLRSADH